MLRTDDGGISFKISSYKLVNNVLRHVLMKLIKKTSPFHDSVIIYIYIYIYI